MNIRIPMIVLVVCCLLALLPLPVHAGLPYDSYYMDSNSDTWRQSQAVYVPDQVIQLSFMEPVDLYIDDRDLAYVVDRAANQIVVMNRDGNKLLTVGDTEGQGALNAPEGVFVTGDGTIYVADSGNRRIALFSDEGKFLRAYMKPDSSYLTEEDYFVPSKLVVDKRGVMYIVLSGDNRGLFRMDGEGRYTGYFGANKAEQSYTNWVKRLVLNKEQLEKEEANLPQPIVNAAMDAFGFLYTATPMAKSGIKKLNAGGVDAFHNRHTWHSVKIIDLAVDRDGFLYGIDFDSGTVTIYDPYGSALFAFGGIDAGTQQKGIFGYPTGIALSSRHDIWVTDSKTKQVLIFVRTGFGQDVLTGTKLYMQGRYEESKPYWEKVRMQNGMLSSIFQGLGKVDLAESKYAQAMDHFKEAYDVDGYSQAFWEVRLQWLQRYLIALLAALVIFILAVRYTLNRFSRYAAKRQWPPKLVRYTKELKDMGSVLIHPYNGFYKMKERKVSFVVMLFILLFAVLVKIMRTYGTGFIFNPVDISMINVFSELAFFTAPWVTWVIANYLVCSVKNGEGRFHEVLQASVYALVPYLFFSIPILILSNVVVLEEQVLVTSLEQIMVIWLCVLFFVMTQVIHNFEFVETLKNSLITVFTVLIIWFFLFVASGLTYNVYDFLYQLQREVAQYV
ncbi:YIP1 family protein [Paenibacillus eucommiae]|uniref:Tetratricopeptide (TPR) repeat protein n=1 Tax=Paenibacillus eucommiae TaxID=1355755 RepID=A0ABS4IW32_9BACL|nr:YIP1 family protein [Paenibacillus eucommiae]MBP1991805.1 tetratricopeptide (TPR) repeat protein [Paenibacillus eucommiae]